MLLRDGLKVSPSLSMYIWHVQTNKSQAALVRQAVQQLPIRKCKSTGHDWPMLHKLAKLCSLRLVSCMRVQRNERYTRYLPGLPWRDLACLCRMAAMKRLPLMEPGECIEDMDIFHRALVLYMRSKGMPCIKVLPLRTGGMRSLVS